MKVKIAAMQHIFLRLLKGLEWDDEKEKMALMLCHSTTYGDSVKLMPHKVIIPKLKMGDFLLASLLAIRGIHRPRMASPDPISPKEASGRSIRR